MKRILVPCDFSTPAVQAYLLAIDLAMESNGEVFVLEAIDLPERHETTFGVPPYSYDPGLFLMMEARAKEHFEELRKKSARKITRVSFDVKFGSVKRSILDFIEEKQIDLVVMGTHGASGFKEFVVGSNTEKITRLSPVPVFSVQTAVPVDSIRNIVFPGVLSGEQPGFIKKLKELQAFFGAGLHVLLVNTPSDFISHSEANALLEDFAQHYQLSNYTLNVRNGLFEQDGIHRFVEEIKADMIAMATHGRRGLAHLFYGSITEDIVNHAVCPVWTCVIKKTKS